MENWYKKAINPSKELEDEDDLLMPFDEDRWTTVDSSFLKAVAYYPLAHILEVKLKDDNRYTFMNVPPNVYKNFMEAPSKGTFFNLVLRRNYSGQ